MESKDEEVKESPEASGGEAIQALTAQVKEMNKELKKAQAESKKAAKAADDAKAALDEARAELDANKLNMGGNNLKKMSAWRMPPTSSHVVAGTKATMPSGNAIVNA